MTAIGSALPVPFGARRNLPVVEVSSSGELAIGEPETGPRWRRRQGEREASTARPRPVSPRESFHTGWRPEDAVAAYRAAVHGGASAPVLDVLA